MRGDPRHPGPYGPRPKPVLTPRQEEIVPLVAAGLKNRQIAAILGLSESSIGNYISTLLRRLGLSSRLQISLWFWNREAKAA